MKWNLFSRYKNAELWIRNNLKSIGVSGEEWGGLGAIYWMSVKLKGTMLTLLGFCQLSMTCIILHACFPGSGDRQGNQSRFTASLSLNCSTQPPLHFTLSLSVCPTMGLKLSSDIVLFLPYSSYLQSFVIQHSLMKMTLIKNNLLMLFTKK